MSEMVLPAGVEQAFRAAAVELGMCSAARLFVRELLAQGGTALVTALRDALGRVFPVLDFVASSALLGEPEPVVDPTSIVEALTGVTRLCVVGLETDFLDALSPRLPDAELGLLVQGGQVDVRRVLANYGGHIRAVGLDDFQQWAGRRSALWRRGRDTA